MVTEETVSRPAPRVVTATVRARFDAAPAVVFDAIAGADVLPRLFKGYGLVAGIVGTSDQVGSWDRPGSTHVVRMSDGGTALETITHYEPSRRYAYRVTDFTLAVRHVAAYATGDWTLEPDGLGTRLTCIYTMHAKNSSRKSGCCSLRSTSGSASCASASTTRGA